ncbi:TetR/AcrR family transcriptional regulator [Novosphingobium sp. G106]|uniref:TetR/AcrR family transcriptional regulator n=1 Tax=Novosphingobium sp. G106 TaxID=2849500 RepID=UPI001C2D7F9D|nr:TetR/AcrR family transcriptional regulator [Novosphingobium sp. G106]MBV1687923.1 TetR/AcrR family transcriptional regulator [Novosphingobium sp. G106]
MPAAQAQSRPLPGDFQRRRKEDNRQQLLAAATVAFCAEGYFAVSIDEIASAAGVSRMTFYRHFRSKAALAAELFKLNSQAAMPRFVAVGHRDFRDHIVVQDWIMELFAADRASGPILRVFMQANADEPGFAEQAHGFIGSLISELGRIIPAFALDSAAPLHRKRWIEAWLLLYEILDQGNHAARGASVAADPLIAEVVAHRFVAFVNGDARIGAEAALLSM